MTRAVFLAVLVAVAAGCAADPYPLLTPAGASDWVPTAIGRSVRGVVLYLEPRPGDRIELVSAEALGVGPEAGAKVYFSPPVHGGDGSVTIGETLGPVPGATAGVDAGTSPGPGNEVGLVVELTPTVAGTYAVSGVRVSFRVNGGPVETKEGVSMDFTACADDPVPSSCGPTPGG